MTAKDLGPLPPHDLDTDMGQPGSSWPAWSESAMEQERQRCYLLGLADRAKPEADSIDAKSLGPLLDGWYWYEEKTGDLSIIEIKCGAVYASGSDVAARLSDWHTEGEFQFSEGRVLGPVAPFGRLEKLQEDLIQRIGTAQGLEEFRAAHAVALAWPVKW